jgi:phosphopantetheinyl transferase
VFSVVYDSLEREMDVSLITRFLDERETRVFRAVLDPDRALQFLWGRALFVHVMRSFLGVDAARLDIDPGGRPYVADGRLQGCDINLSHCRGHIVMALSAIGSVGIDVELNHRATTDVAERFFSRSEVAWMKRLDPAARDHAFGRLWTTKEACTKAVGTGHKPPFVSIEVPPRGCGRWPRGTWWGIELGDDVACSVAVKSPRRLDRLRPTHVPLDRRDVRASLRSLSTEPSAMGSEPLPETESLLDHPSGGLYRESSRA